MSISRAHAGRRHAHLSAPESLAVAVARGDSRAISRKLF